MPRLYLSQEKRVICEISEDQLEFLRERLVQEGAEDREYFIDKDTLDMLQDDGCDEALLAALREASSDRQGELKVEGVVIGGKDGTEGDSGRFRVPPQKEPPPPKRRLRFLNMWIGRPSRKPLVG
jgi:hypothetical protein